MTRWSPIIVAVIAAVATIVAGLIGVLGKSSPPSASVESVSDTVGPEGQRLIEVTGKVTSLDPDHPLRVVVQPIGKQLWYVSAPITCDTGGTCHGEVRIPKEESSGLGASFGSTSAGGVHQQGDNFVTDRGTNIDSRFSSPVRTIGPSTTQVGVPPSTPPVVRNGAVAPPHGADPRSDDLTSPPINGGRAVAPTHPDSNPADDTPTPTVPSSPVSSAAAVPGA